MRPTESCVTPKAIPIARAPITIGPRLGLRNHLVRLKSVIKAAALPPAIANVAQNFFFVPPITEAQNTALNNPIPRIKVKGTFGSRRKLLNEIARYSLSKTATQKTGNENIKNETKVIE